MSLDRFSQGKKDAQDEPVYAYCDCSGNEIFLGESYLETSEGQILEDKFETVLEHFNVVRKYAGEDIV
jgi:hypothetical protein